MNIDKLTFIGLIDVVQTMLYDLQREIKVESTQYIYDRITENLSDLETIKQNIMRGDNK